jgi:hypothetical protein
VIDVQMGADHLGNRLAGAARLLQVFEEGQMHLVPLGKGRTYLIVADAGIDDDPLILRLDQERMDTELDFSGLVGKGRIEPIGLLANIFGGRVR